MVKSAPRPRTNSSSSARARPVTRQPRSCASGDDVAADRAGRAGHQQRCRRRRVAEQVDDLRGGQPVERHRRRRDQVQLVGYDGDVSRRDDELLGVRAEVAVEPADQPGDPGAHRQVHARPGGDDGAGEVPAQAGVVGLVDQPRARGRRRRDRQVDRVDRRRGDLDPDLAGPRLDHGNVDDLDRVGSARGADDGGAEGRCSWFCLLGSCSAVAPATTMEG